MSETPVASPLAELMARDPVNLTSTDLDAIIAELRKQRHRFVVAGDRKIGTPAARKSKAQKDREARSNLLSKDEMSNLFNDL